MKFFITAFITVFTSAAFSQNLQFTVSAFDKTITVSPDEENTDNVFTFKVDQLNQPNSLITIHILHEETDKDWKRNFSIYDSTDNAIQDFVFMKDGSYCIKLQNIASKLKVNNNYFIYTIALPKDPQKAMLVKIGRRLVCEIKIR